MNNSFIDRLIKNSRECKLITTNNNSICIEKYKINNVTCIDNKYQFLFCTNTLTKTIQNIMNNQNVILYLLNYNSFNVNYTYSNIIEILCSGTGIVSSSCFTNPVPKDNCTKYQLIINVDTFQVL